MDRDNTEWPGSMQGPHLAIILHLFESKWLQRARGSEFLVYMYLIATEMLIVPPALTLERLTTLTMYVPIAMAESVSRHNCR